ncbi:hypothetical protein APSETT445_003997 [Aspergillus pseudonomiae]
MPSKERPDIMHIEEASHQSPLHDDIEEAKAKTSSIYEVGYSSQDSLPCINVHTSQENAVGYKEYREGLHIEITAKENSKVRWKIDMVVLPIFLVTQALQFMDKTALNYANLFGYQETLGLKGQQFNYLSARVRFIMGVFEAAVTPGLTLMTGFWYTRQEIPLRQCIWYSALGFGGIIGSYISFGISKLPEDFKPVRWELLFYILGAATCLWAFVIFFVLPDSPSSAFFLTRPERIIAVKRVAGNETGIKNKAFNKKQGMVAFYDPKAIMLFISVFAAAIPNGVVNSFSTIIIQDMGFTQTKTTELKSVGDAVVIIALFIGGTITLNVPNSRLLTSTAANILCTVAAACMAYLPRSMKWSRLVCFWLVNAQSVGFTVSLVTISSNMAGYTHRAMANALVL